MAIPIRPEDLPAGTPTNTAAIPFDSGTQVQKATPLDIINAGTPLASQAEAEAGVDNVKRVTSLRVAQAVAAQIPNTPFSQSAGYGASSFGEKLQQEISVTDAPYLADPSGVANSTTAFTAAASGARVLIVPQGEYKLATTPAFTGVLAKLRSGSILTGSGAAPLGFTGGSIMEQWLHNTDTPDQFATFYIRKNRTGSGGTPFYSSATIRADTYVADGATDFNWTANFNLDNSASDGQNVACYPTAIKRAAGPTWAMCATITDLTGPSPSTPAIGLEIDVDCNGADSNFSRVGLDIATRRPSTNPGGAAAVCGYGVRLQNGLEADSTFLKGYGAYAGTIVGDLFDASEAINTGAAFKMKAGDIISFDAGYQHTLKYQSGGGLDYNVSGSLKFRIGQDGGTRQALVAVADLGTPDAGRRAIVNNSFAAGSGNFGAVVAGGGANVVPVYADGTNWRVG